MKTISGIGCLIAGPALALALGCSSTATSTAAPEPIAENPTPAVEPAPTVTPGELLDRVYFETNEARLSPKARNTLEHAARIILEHPEWGAITVEGHCDERGSDAHNRALGDRRALAVATFLAGQGIPEPRLTTKSYGEVRPAAHGHDEPAWRLNRRSELTFDSLETADRSAQDRSSLAGSDDSTRADLL